MNTPSAISPDTAEFHRMMQQTMAAFAAAWARGDIDGLMALLAENPVYRTSGGAVFEGRENVRSGFMQICQPSASSGPPPRMHFFENKCVSYWVLPLTASDGSQITVEGVDILTFDEDARLMCKDAYRKLG